MLFISYIRKDVNKILLLLIIVLLLIFAWHSAYYEITFKNISMQYDKELQKLQESTGKAVLEKSDETAQSKGTFQKDKEAFEQKYLELNAENEELKIEKGKLQTELNSIKSELEVTKSKLNKLQEQFQQVQNSLISANEQISSLIYRNQELCRKLEERGGEC